VDGIRLRVYGPEKTLADCFKYRNKLGLDVSLEALKLYLARKRPRIDKLTKFAVICRVERLMRPYFPRRNAHQSQALCACLAALSLSFFSWDRTIRAL
jgi:hypothetical protein